MSSHQLTQSEIKQIWQERAMNRLDHERARLAAFNPDRPGRTSAAIIEKNIADAQRRVDRGPPTRDLEFRESWLRDLTRDQLISHGITPPEPRPERLINGELRDPTAVPGALPTLIRSAERGADKMHIEYMSQNVIAHGVRFNNARGYDGLYEKISDTIDKVGQEGSVNIILIFKTPDGHIYRSITEADLNSQADFEARLGHIMAKNIVGSEGVDDGAEMYADMFVAQVIGRHALGGSFPAPVLSVENVESDNCTVSVLMRLGCLPGGYELGSGDPIKLATAVQEMTRAKHMVIKDEIHLALPQLRRNMLINKCEYTLKLTENEDCLTLTKSVEAKATNIPREIYTHGGRKYYKLEVEDLKYAQLVDQDGNDTSDKKTNSYVYGAELVDLKPTQRVALVGTGIDGVRKLLHVDLVANPLKCNVYYSGSTFYTRPCDGRPSSDVGQSTRSAPRVDTYTKVAKSEVFNNPRMTVIYGFDCETVVDKFEGNILKVYSCSASAVPEIALTYLECLATEKYASNLKNLIKYREQRIPYVKNPNPDLVKSEFFSEDVHLDKSSFKQEYGEPVKFIEKDKYAVIDSEEEYKGPGFKTNHYKNIAVKDGYLIIKLMDITTPHPTYGWSSNSDSTDLNPFDVVYKAFETDRIDTKFVFLGFNNSSFDNLLLFPYLKDREIKRKNIGEDEQITGIRVKNPLFVRGILNMSIMDIDGFEHNMFDIAKHIPGSLASISKKWKCGNLSKSSLDHAEVQHAYDHGHFDQYIEDNLEAIQAYNSLDTLAPVLISHLYFLCFDEYKLYCKMKAENSKHNWSFITIGSLVHSITKYNMKHYKIQPQIFGYNMFEEIRASTVAGRCDLTNGPCSVYGLIASLDIKSAYPYQMCIAREYFPYGNYTFTTWQEFDEMYGSITDDETGEIRALKANEVPIGLFYGTLDSSHLNVNPNSAAKTKTGNDWNAQYVTGWHSVDIIKHTIQVGGKFKPLSFGVQRSTEYNLDLERIGLKNEIEEAQPHHDGLIYKQKAKNYKFFEHLHDFMKAKNEQDAYKAQIEVNYAKRKAGLEVTEQEEAFAAQYNESKRTTAKLASNSASGKPYEDIHHVKTKFMKIKEYQDLMRRDDVSNIRIDQQHSGGMVVHYEVNREKLINQQSDIILTKLIYDRTRIYLYNNLHAKMPEYIKAPELSGSDDVGPVGFGNAKPGEMPQKEQGIIYVDTDSGKMRNYVTPENGCNPYEFVKKQHEATPLEHWPEIEKVDPNLKGATLATDCVYGSFGDEYADYKTPQLRTHFLGKKTYITMSVDDKGEEFAMVAKARGIKSCRDVIANHLIGTFIIKREKFNKKGEAVITYDWAEGVTELMKVDFLRRSRAEKKVFDKEAGRAIEIIKSGQPLLICSDPIIKHLRNPKSAELGENDRYDTLNLKLTSSVMLKCFRF